jgi:hypothetical protein
MVMYKREAKMKLPWQLVLAFFIITILISGYAGWRLHGNSKTTTPKMVPVEVRYDDSGDTTEATVSTNSGDETTGSTPKIQNANRYSFVASKDSTWRIEGVIWSPTPPEKVAITKLTFTGQAQAILDPTAGLRFEPITPSLEITTPAGPLKLPKPNRMAVLVGIGGSVYPRERIYPMVWGGLQIKKFYVGAYWSNSVGVQFGVRL